MTGSEVGIVTVIVSGAIGIAAKMIDIVIEKTRIRGSSDVKNLDNEVAMTKTVFETLQAMALNNKDRLTDLRNENRKLIEERDEEHEKIIKIESRIRNMEIIIERLKIRCADSNCPIWQILKDEIERL